MLKKDENNTVTGKIAVVGDKDSVLAFKAIGLEVHAVESADEAATVLKNSRGTARSYSLPNKSPKKSATSFRDIRRVLIPPSFPFLRERAATALVWTA